MLNTIAALALAWIAGAAIYSEGMKQLIEPTSVAVIAEKWGAIFGVPASVLTAIAFNESRFNVRAANLISPGDLARGGAWGLMQQTLSTAKSNVASLLASSYRDDANVKTALLLWDGTGKSLFDPTLNIMLGAFQLATYLKRFGGNLDAAIGAYNRGGAGMAEYLASGKDPSKLGYVMRVRGAMET